jgi:hypothetical protein
MEVIDRLTSSREVATLKIPFNALFLDQPARAVLVEEFIRRDHSFKSFVAPEKLADCLRPLVDGLWEKISVILGMSIDSCKSTLKGVIDLRNRIAHEADVNPAYGGIELWPIYSEDVERSIDFLRSLGAAVAEIVSQT